MEKANIINNTDKNRFKPIMNNHIYDEEISYEDVLKELKLYIDKGFGGIAINGRSKEFVNDVDAWLPKYFETVKKFCKGAKELGIDMWIFDEWGFPSGSAAGLVLNGENRAKRLNKTVDITVEKGKNVNIPVPDRFVSAGAMRVSRFAAYHSEEAAEILKPENGMINYTATEKTRIVIVTYEDTSFHTMEMRDIKNMDLNDPTVGTADIMDFDTVKSFIQNMHERYKEAIGDEFGKTVKGFFYDEPEIYWEYPYSPGLPQFFKKLNGYDMEEILPELMAYLPCGGIDLSGKGYHKRIQKLFGDYREACTEMLKQNFYGQLEEWCHENNLLSVGHQDMDDNIASINTISGDFYKNSSRNDMPGIDVIHADIAPEIFTDFPRYAGSIKRLLNKSGAMSETFGVMGEDMPPNTRRYVMEHQIMRGIDTFFLYISVSETEKGDYKKEAMERADFFARLVNSGKPKAEVALLMPMSDMTYKRMTVNPHSLNEAPMPWERADMTAEALCYAPIDFDYAWEENLDNLYDRGFRYLILTGSPVTEKAVEGIKKFYNAGGKVISVFKPAEQLGFGEFYYRLGDMIEALPKKIAINPKEGSAKISCLEVENEDGTVIYALLNEGDSFVNADIEFLNDNDRAYYDFERGIWCKANGKKGDLRENVFAPLELKLFRIGGGYDADETVESVTEIKDWSFNGKKLDKLVPWTELGLEGYSGTGEYEAEFDWDGGTARISMGDVRCSAEVYINDEKHSLPFAPWAFYIDLPKGRHKIKAVVLNSGASADYAIPDKWHRPWEQPYLKCGLLGTPKIEKIKN